MFLFPTRSHPLLKFPFAFGKQIGGVSPGEDCFVGARNVKHKIEIAAINVILIFIAQYF